MRSRFRRPSFPTVISLLALFVALGGTSYAVVKLPARSVGNRELKPNAVTAGKIRNGSIGVADLSSSAAGRRGARGPQGPAGPAGSATSAAPEPWQPLPFSGSWTHYGSGHASGAFRRDQLGRVHLRGLVTKLGGGSETIAQLPPGFRPPERLMFGVALSSNVAIDAGRLDVFPDGSVVRATPQGGEPDFTSLDTVSFWTD